jgi:hypothetical protein
MIEVIWFPFPERRVTISRGFYRIVVTVDTNTFPWAEYPRRRNEPEEIARALGELAGQRGDHARDYWFSTNPIAATRWMAVERYEENTWRPICMAAPNGEGSQLAPRVDEWPGSPDPSTRGAS